MIRSIFVAAILCLVLSVGSVAHASETKSDAYFQLRWEASEAQADKLFFLVQQYQIVPRVSAFVDQNLHLDQTVEVVVHQGGEPIFDRLSQRVYLPVSVFYELYASVQNRYPEQLQTAERLFAASAERLVWQQLVKLLVSQFALRMEGEEAFVLDSFATLSLLNLYDNPYVMDAAEEFLLVEDADLVFSERYPSEEELDKARYQRMACLILGRDYQPYLDVLDNLSWDNARIENCQKRYQQELVRWLQALEGRLKEGSRMPYWLPADYVPEADEVEPELEEVSPAGLNNLGS